MATPLWVRAQWQLQGTLSRGHRWGSILACCGTWGREGIPEVSLAPRFQKYPLSKSLFSHPCPKTLGPGVTNPRKIQKNVKEAIGGQYSLFCLGFGFDVSYTFLEKMARDNGGLARRIYEDSDSALQLQVPAYS